MVAATYVPPPDWQLPPANGGDPIGHLSCVAYSGAFLINAATEGRSHPTGRQVREATHDANGGLELAQLATVMKRDYEIDVTAGVWTTGLYEERIASGLWGAVLIGGYRPIGASAYAGQKGGDFNHGIAEIQKRIVMDPLADGRHSPPVYRFHGASYPASLIRDFAAGLRLSNGHLSGPNHFEAVLCPLPGASTSTPPPGGTLVLSGPATSEKNAMISQSGSLSVVSNYVKALVKNQPLFRYPSGPKVTVMSSAAHVDYIGNAGGGWHAVKVRTGAPYVDKVSRPTILYVPAASGPVTAK